MRCLNCGKEFKGKDIICPACNGAVPSQLKHAIDTAKQFMAILSDGNPYQEYHEKSAQLKRKKVKAA